MHLQLQSQINDLCMENKRAKNLVQMNNFKIDNFDLVKRYSTNLPLIWAMFETNNSY